MNLGEIRDDVLTKLGESLTAPAFWSIRDVDRAINEGYQEISDATEWNEVRLAIPLTSRRTYYNILNYDLELLNLTRVFNPTTSRWLDAGSIRELDSDRLDWGSSGGEGDRFFRRGLFWIGVMPWATSDKGILRVSGSAMPRPLVRRADIPGFPVQFHPALVEYALHELKAQDHEPSQALSHFETYRAYENDLKEHLNSRLNLDQHHVLGVV